MKPNRPLKTQGFTLVELLVVIVIIASLAGLSMTILPRMLARSKATEAMQNQRQITSLLATYASDHSMTLPPIEGEVRLADGTVEMLQWNEVCLTLVYPDTDRAKFKDKKWWTDNKSILKNPMYKASAPLTPGYAMNEMIAKNVDTNADLTTTVALSLISDPVRTPLIAPYTDFHYSFSAGEVAGFKNGPASVLLSEGKLPISFVDGHMETMTPKEYRDRKLDEMPNDLKKN